MGRWFCLGAGTMIWTAAIAEAAPGCPPGASQAVRVLLATATPEALPIKEDVRTEISAIWSRAGVDLVWLNPSGAKPSDGPVLRVIIQDEEVKGTLPRVPVLAWIMFSDGMPRDIVRASTRAARALLTRRKLGRYRIHFARAIAWSIAHEIGHYLLASTHHDVVGLMRPAFDADDIAEPEPTSVTLPPSTLLRLRSKMNACPRMAP